jgi:hypothetical protein
LWISASEYGLVRGIDDVGAGGAMPTRSIGCALLVAALALASPHRVEAAGGAFAVDDAEIGAPGSCKVESWVSFASNHDFVGVVSPACVVNIGRPVELGVQGTRSRADGEWGTSGAVKAKTNLIPLDPHKLGVGLSGAITYDLRTGENTAINVNVPVTLEITEQFKFNMNGGWLWDRVAELHYLTWGAGFEWNFVKPVTLIVEMFGQAGRLPIGEDGLLGQRSITQPRFQAGLRFTPHEKIDIDLIYGRNITGEDANWFTVGLNVRL